VRLQRATAEQGREQHRAGQPEFANSHSRALSLAAWPCETPRAAGVPSPQLLHWTIVVLIIVQFTPRLAREDLPPLKKLGNARAATNPSASPYWPLAILRLAWRWLNPTPALPETLKPYQRVAGARLARP